MNILRLKNPIQNYAWGSHTAISAVLGLPPSAEPQAELWMSAHPRASSDVWLDDSWQPLIEVIDRSPETMLGVASNSKPKLSFLLKILAAARPLSIQAHPNLEQATSGFAREESLGIDIGSSQRNYRDANHKPEILYALTPFTVLRGFRPLPEAQRLLASAGLGELLGDSNTAWPDFLKAYFGLAGKTVEDAYGRVLESANLGPLVETWLRRLALAYPGDRGVLAPLFLQLFTLDSGEALFTGPGVLHAYLEGLGVELMANSDNVLRGGLTAKHVDPDELLAVVSSEFVDPSPLKSRKVQASRRFCAPLGGLELTEVYLDEDHPELTLGGGDAQMVLCLEGRGRICAKEHPAHVLDFEHGDSFFVPAAVDNVSLAGKGRLFVAGASSPSD